MSLTQRVRTELQRLAHAGGGSPQRLVVDGGRGVLEVDLTEIGSIGCAFTRFAYASGGIQDRTIDELQRLAEDLEKRLSYLLERIHPIEIDQDACIVQMRSNPPAKDDDGTKYYELVVRRRELCLCRYARQAGQPRTVVPAHVTHEVVLRLADDFAAALP